MNAFVGAACMAYNLALFAGTAYLVGWHGWSPWWFVATLIGLCTISTRKRT